MTPTMTSTMTIMMMETITNFQWVPQVAAVMEEVPPVAAVMEEVPPVAAAMEVTWVLLDIKQ